MPIQICFLHFKDNESKNVSRFCVRILKSQNRKVRDPKKKNFHTITYFSLLFSLEALVHEILWFEPLRSTKSHLEPSQLGRFEPLPSTKTLKKIAESTLTWRGHVPLFLPSSREHLNHLFIYYYSRFIKPTRLSIIKFTT